MEEQLRDHRPMVALLGFELVDLVEGPGPALVVQIAHHSLLDNQPIPAAVENRRVAGGRNPAPEGRQPVSLIVRLVAAGNLDARGHGSDPAHRPAASARPSCRLPSSLRTG